MATFGPISTLPTILPNLFGLTGQAVSKNVIQEIQPTLEILELLAASNALELPIVAAQNVAAPGLVRVPELTVPQTEAWLVRGFGCVASTGAAELLRGRLISGRTSSVGDLAIRQHGTPFYSSATDAAAVSLCAAAANGAFFLFANDFLGFSVERITTAATIAVQVRAQIYRFQI